MNEQQFTCQLLYWHRTENDRQMPWKGEKDAYKIWLSEVILQQTRVEQGWQYYERFVEKYPAIKDLAAATDEEVFKLWEGLGYYNRCKNLLYTARFITNERNGIFPDKYEDILALKGIGNYTASAIASFAFDLAYAVVDGNVLRVLSRVFGIKTPIDTTEGKQEFSALSEKLLDKEFPAAYNQAIMDFGATICTPSNPLCKNCHLQNICYAYKYSIADQLPVKEKRLVRKMRWLTYFIFIHEGNILINKRIEKDIWQNLYEFYLVENKQKHDWTKQKVKKWLLREHNSHSDKICISTLYEQQLTHQNIKAQFIQIALDKIPETLRTSTWVKRAETNRLPFPKIINTYWLTEVFETRF